MTDPPDETRDPATSTDEQTQVTESSEWELQTQRAFDPAAQNSLVVTIVTAVADVEDTSATQIDPPLQEVVDVEAISKSFASYEATSTERSFSVEFPYRSHRIVVRGDAWVQVFSKQSE